MSELDLDLQVKNLNQICKLFNENFTDFKLEDNKAFFALVLSNQHIPFVFEDNQLSFDGDHVVELLFANDDLPVNEIFQALDDINQKKGTLPEAINTLSNTCKLFDFMSNSLCRAKLFGGNSKSPLNGRNKKAIEHVDSYAKPLSDKAAKSVLEKVTSLGYDLKTYHKLIDYVKNTAPIIIHIDLTRHMKHLLQDGFYRNCFEVDAKGVSYDGQRREAETRMFGTVYDDVDVPFNRPRYGSINIYCANNGVQSAYAYGDSYLQLKNEVKERTTFCQKDSFYKDIQVGTFDNFLHVLDTFPTNELDNMIKVMNGSQVTNKKNFEYKETQIHGKIQFNRDVEFIMVNKRHLSDQLIMNQLKIFCERNNVEMKIME